MKESVKVIYLQLLKILSQVPHIYPFPMYIQYIYITSQFDLRPYCLVFKSYKCAVRVGVLSSVMTGDQFQGSRKHKATHHPHIPVLQRGDFRRLSLWETRCLQDRR